MNDIDAIIESTGLSDDVMNDLTRDEMIRAIGNARDKAFSTWFITGLCLAAETNPDELRHALGKVFKLSKLESDIKAIKEEIKAVQWGVKDSNDNLTITSDKIDSLTKMVEEAQFNLEQTIYGE